MFAPEGAELDAHLKLIAAFNARPEEPTAWQEDVCRGPDYLADKPLAITPAVFAKTEEAVRLAEREGLFFADIMTERNEITTILQRALAF